MVHTVEAFGPFPSPARRPSLQECPSTGRVTPNEATIRLYHFTLSSSHRMRAPQVAGDLYSGQHFSWRVV